MYCLFNNCHSYFSVLFYYYYFSCLLFVDYFAIQSAILKQQYQFLPVLFKIEFSL